jgi:hypothetical protein
MAKYDVTYSCGHTDRIALFGKERDRQHKIEWFERNGLCPDCYKAQQQAELAKVCDIVRIKYADYKNDKAYADCKTVANSYDAETKTIEVFVKKPEPKKYRKITKANVMRCAWSKARTYAAKLGIKAKDALSTALKEAWAEANAITAMVMSGEAVFAD